MPEYFDLLYFDSYRPKAGSSYDSEDEAANWFKSTTHKLQELVTLLSERLNVPLVVNYSERPNGQGGRGKIVFKTYNLIGFVPAELDSVREIFIKIFFHDLDDENAAFGTEVDINAKLPDNRFASKRQEIRDNTYWDIPIKEMPNSWEALLDQIELPIRENISYVLSLLISEESTSAPHFKQTRMSLNQIFYGPPGTGKTYHTIDAAIKITNPSFDLSQDRRAIKDEFQRLCKSGHIHFTTFHQSMNYEDFIEGLKPQKPEKKGDVVTYDIEPGIFKMIAETAKSNWEDSKEINKAKLNFEEAFTKLQDEWEENPEMKFPLKTKGYDYTIISFSNTSIHFKKASGGTGHTLSINTLKNLYYGQEYDFKHGVGIYYPAILNKLWSYKSQHATTESLQNFVLIIDEINRGNVSQIFGELITLIEDDKRLGRDEALEVVLPYSKERFGVPPNLFIVGTMNTADRSVEALDTALRRRFSFEFMPPNSDLLKDEDGNEKAVQGISLKRLLDKINERITYLLDEDHQIGHAYFCDIEENNEEELKNVFRNKIIPLLREYFYNDHAKIRLILGQGFVEKRSKVPSFALKDEDDLVIEKSSYAIKELNEGFDIVGALKMTVGE